MVSVVILTMGYPQKVMACLEKQAFKDFEIIVAQEKGIVNAMNAAVKRAKGDIIVRIDDDVEMAPNWLGQLIEPFQDPFVAGVTGPTFVPLERRKNRDSIRMAENPNWLLKWLFDYHPLAPAMIYKCGGVSYDSNFQEKFVGDLFHQKFLCDHLEGTNWAMRKCLIDSAGGFDPKFDGVAEWYDTDLEKRVLKAFPSLVLVYNPRAYLYHMLEKGGNFHERFQGLGRVKNWLRFHIRHSKFHPKMIVWFLLMVGYSLWKMVKPR